MSYRERPDEEGCPGKHPLVNREERILLNQRLEERQIESERKLCRDAEQVAPDVSHLGIASRSTCQDDDAGSAASHQHTDSLLPGDRFLQNQERENHRKDRHRGRHDAGVAWRGETQTDGIAALVAYQSEDAGTCHLDDVLGWDMFSFSEE